MFVIQDCNRHELIKNADDAIAVFVTEASALNWLDAICRRNVEIWGMAFRDSYEITPAEKLGITV